MLEKNEVVFLNEKSRHLRKLIIEMIGRLGVGHVGGSLSIVEVLAVLYNKEMNIDPKNPKMPERDRFVLSKGHAGPALYATLADRGYFPVSELATLNKPNTNLPSHCDMRRTVGIDMTAGSLGQGLSAAVGMAIGAKLDKSPIRVYALIGDGESQEGQIWEAAMLAAQHKLDNLTVFLDYNKMQIDGMIEDIVGLAPVDKKWESFGWNVMSVNGHDVEEIYDAIERAKEYKGKPTMIILNTIKGKGAYFAEGKLSGHSMNVTEEMAKKAVELLYQNEGEDNARR